MSLLRSAALVALVASSAIAAPFEKRSNYSSHCMSDAQAQQVATTWGALIANYDADLASAALTENFTDYSESVNTLINSCPQGSAAITLPLLDPTFSTRDAFELGQGQQPPINFEQLNIWHSCDTVMIRWVTTNTANITNVKPVVGIISMETVKAPEGSQFQYLINTLYSEFDAGAWLQNLVEAGTCPGGAALSSPTSSPIGSVAAPTGSETPTGAPSAKGAPVRSSTLSEQGFTTVTTSDCTTTTASSYGATVSVLTLTTAHVTETAKAYA